ncbi:MAG TPA: hypothetical protein VMA34_05045 [Terracidiphilus sp.]|nr:hypothetical protein [Terracidiphilus sp.]
MSLATCRPIVIFDTSAVNAIYDDLDRDKKIHQLSNIYLPRLTFAVVDEVLATPDDYRRTQLFEVTLKLQNAGDCILPFHYLFMNHVRAFACGAKYDWTLVNCYGHKLKEAIVEQRHGLEDSLIREQRKQNLDLDKQFKQKFKGIRGRLQEDNEWRDRFQSLDEFMKFAFADDGPYWREAVAHVKRALQIWVEEEESKEPSDAKVIQELKEAESRFSLQDAIRFAESSPPFKAHIYGIACTAYSWVHNPSLNSRQRETAAGRIDTFTTLYLPYCRYFVTNDRGQFDCHRNVGSMIGNRARIFMYQDFWEELPYD